MDDFFLFFVSITEGQPFQQRSRLTSCSICCSFVLVWDENTPASPSKGPPFNIWEWWSFIVKQKNHFTLNSQNGGFFFGGGVVKLQRCLCTAFLAVTFFFCPTDSAGK